MQKQDGNTLVVVTADHETGGLAITGGSVSRKKVSGGPLEQEGHTATMVPVFSYGPDSETFSGIYDNTKIFEKIHKFTEIKLFSSGFVYNLFIKLFVILDNFIKSIP